MGPESKPAQIDYIILTTNINNSYNVLRALRYTGQIVHTRASDITSPDFTANVDDGHLTQKP